MKSANARWPIWSLEDLVQAGTVELGRGVVISKPDMEANPGVFPVYSSAKDGNGKFGEYGRYLFDEELITWSVDGGGHLFHRPKHKFSITNVSGFLRILTPDRISYRYLYYALILEHSKVAFDWVKKAHISTLRKEYTNIPVPPLPEQKRIVAILGEAFAGIDKAIANTEKNLANARQLFDNSLDSVFSQQVEGWVQKSLGDIATFKNGLNFTKGSKGEIIKIVGVKDFQKNFYVPTGQLETAQIDGRLSADYELRAGDILTVRSNGNKQLIGRCILASEVPERTSHSGFTIRIRTASEEVSPAYLVHFLKSKRSRDMLIASGDGANISSLNQQALSSLPVTLPPIADQLAITERIGAVAAETQNLEVIYQRKLDNLAELNQAILRKAFAGELTAHPEKALQEAAE